MTPRLLALALLLPLAGCPARDGGKDRAPLGPLARGLLALGERARVELKLDVPNERATSERLAATLGRVCGAIARDRLAGSAAVERINRVVFAELGFRREVDDRSPEFMLLSRLLQGRRGSCLGLSALYLSLGEACGLPIRGVLVPGHFFVRLDGGAGGRRGIELLKRGRAMPERWYRDKYRVPAGNPTYLEQSLSAEQSLAVFRYNLANELRLRGRYGRARAEYERVLATLPRFAEARASLGLVHQLAGRPAAAEKAYRRALRDNPGIEGLQNNLEALGAARRR